MPSLDFTRRSELSELMDTETVDFADFRACLADLERVNFWTFTYRPILRFLDELASSGRLPAGRPLTIVDVGSGYGGLLRRIDRWAAKRGIAVELAGIDLNPWSAASAAEVTDPGRPIRWVTMNLFDYRPEREIDLIISSQFTHHLDDDGLVRFVSWMEQTARIGWFIGDLHRHKLPYHVFKLWSRLAGWHRFVRNDGPISVARAFVAADWRRVLERAGIPQGEARIVWRMPFRLCVSRMRRP